MQAHSPDAEIAPVPRPYVNRRPAHIFQDAASEQASEVIYLVDDDSQVRDEIIGFLTVLGLKVASFASGFEYLAFKGRDAAACVILSTHLRDLSGLELQRQLVNKGNPPVIFISSQCDIPSTVCAMKAGAIDFLTKPVDLGALAAAVRVALAQDRKLRQKKAELSRLQERFSLLTPREREVLPLIVGGLLNKQAASLLAISEVTLQIHRSQVMRKMQADSFAELVRMAMKLRIPYWRESQRPVPMPEQETPLFVLRNGRGAWCKPPSNEPVAPLKSRNTRGFPILPQPLRLLG